MTKKKTQHFDSLNLSKKSIILTLHFKGYILTKPVAIQVNSPKLNSPACRSAKFNRKSYNWCEHCKYVPVNLSAGFTVHMSKQRFYHNVDLLHCSIVLFFFENNII